MNFTPFVIRTEDNARVSVRIAPMTQQEAESATKNPEWQTDWASEYISRSSYEKYAFRTEDGELIGLAAYQVHKNWLYVQIIYMESSPASNPNIVETKKYQFIGRLMIAYGIKLSIDNGFHGDITLDAKTPELVKHYTETYGAEPLPSLPSRAPRFMICDEAAAKLFSEYLS